MTQIDNGTIKYKDELFRKLIHLTSLSIPIIYYFITTETAALILGILAGLALIINLVRYVHPETGKVFYKFFGFLLREHELDHKKKNLNAWIMWWTGPQTAADTADGQRIRIIHPFHPLQGQILSCVGSKQRRGGERQFMIRHPDGALCLVPASWTDFLPRDPYFDGR